MTTTPRDDQGDRTDAYLWDPSAAPSAEVQSVERELAQLRFEPASSPLSWPARATPARERRPWLYGLAAAAVLVLVSGWSIAQWRWAWPAGRAWTVDAASPAVSSRLIVGSALALPGSERAQVSIARIGTMEVDGGARLTLLATQGTRHRLSLDAGRVRVRMWAPPGSLVVKTPAGEVIDLGCEFDLTVEGSRSIVRVRSGWVQLDNGMAESLVPAGAMSEMRGDRAPGVPVFEDAPPDFLAAVRTLEAEPGRDPEGAVNRMIALARPRDVLTLLLLVGRQVPESDRLAARAAELWPPPSGVTVEGVVRGDRDGLWRWRDTLPLPPPKGWWRNWRDALPGWLIGR